MNYIIIEGPDYTGKSTLVSLLAAKLTEQGYDVETVREPGGTPMAEALRKLLKNKDIPRSRDCELLGMLAARADVISQKVIPAIDAGKVVISDRGNPSSYAYQAYGDPNLINAYERFRPITVPLNPLYVFLDASYETMRKRKAERAQALDAIEMRYDSEQAYNTLREAYAEAASLEPFAIKANTDTSTPEEILCQIILAIKSHLVTSGPNH
jgi:dTMP kinase